MSDDCSPHVVAPCILSDDKAIMLRPETVEALNKLFAGYKDNIRSSRAICRIENFDLHNATDYSELNNAVKLVNKALEEIEKDGNPPRN